MSEQSRPTVAALDPQSPLCVWGDIALRELNMNMKPLGKTVQYCNRQNVNMSLFYFRNYNIRYFVDIWTVKLATSPFFFSFQKSGHVTLRQSQ